MLGRERAKENRIRNWWGIGKLVLFDVVTLNSRSIYNNKITHAASLINKNTRKIRVNGKRKN